MEIHHRCSSVASGPHPAAVPQPSPSPWQPDCGSKLFPRAPVQISPVSDLYGGSGLARLLILSSVHSEKNAERTRSKIRVQGYPEKYCWKGRVSWEGVVLALGWRDGGEGRVETRTRALRISPCPNLTTSSDIPPTSLAPAGGTQRPTS
ncbi:hypothetical protein E2C01_002939 [Portunus trituberculatus]|uniref:Uncharacterized protein n=1 Tax=Portunus trituberculatus TaxID=210409 RepID=A0A5B7CPI6_PORTR|nr:hypothetical protein [Portunus trituberculatus]